MTDRIALALAALAICLLAVDALVLDWGATLFLARKMIGLIDYLAFWR